VDVTEEQARQIVYSIHDAWNRRDLERMLSFYDEDLTFFANLGGPNGNETVIKGKAKFLEAMIGWARLECMSVPQLFRFESGVARASVEFFIKDPKTGQSHSSTYRQIATFRNRKILRLENYHDAAALMAFISLMAK
jgi:ketosteroid isomerase-like protein